MVGVQHERDVEGARRERARPLARQHVEEVRRVAERRDPAGSGRRRPAAGRRWRRCCPSARSGAPPCDTAPAASCRSTSGSYCAERRGQRPQHVHAVGRRQLLHQPDGSAPATGARRGELRLQVAQLGAVRQAAVPEQVADLLERRALSRDRECRSRSTQERRDPHPGNRWRRSRRRRLPGRLWVLLLLQPYHDTWIGNADLDSDLGRFRDFVSNFRICGDLQITSSPVNCWRIESRPV